ncbi:N/A [soil metagenome]
MKNLRSRTITSAVLALFIGFSALGTASAQEPPAADPQMQEVLDQLEALGPEPIPTLTPEEARQQPTPADAVMALLEARGESTAPMPVGNVENTTIPGPAGDIPVRIYTPEGSGPFPVVVYYHGGGWVIASPDVYDASARALTNAANAIVVSVEYRKAPAHPYPAAVDDAFAAFEWATENAESINGDPRNVAVAGESAGGNLAAVVSLRARDEGAQMPVHQLLVYPITNYAFDTPSYEENAMAMPLNRETMMWFFGHYLPNEEAGSDAYVSPLQADDLSGLPPATVILAEIDPLRSEGEAYAQRLSEAGVPVTVQLYTGVTHEFFGMGAVLDKADQAVAVAAQGLTSSFSIPAGLPNTGGGGLASTDGGAPLSLLIVLGLAGTLSAGVFLISRRAQQV